MLEHAARNDYINNYRPIIHMLLTMGYLCHVPMIYINITVTPFKFAAIKVRGFEIMTYSRPFNFAVSYQNYLTVSNTNVVFSYTNKSRNPVC